MMVFPQGDQYHVVPQFFLPADGLQEKSRSERIPYDVWAKQGFLTTIPGPVIIPEVIARAVAEASERYDLQMLAYDRWRISDFQRGAGRPGRTRPDETIWPGVQRHGPGARPG